MARTKIIKPAAPKPAEAVTIPTEEIAAEAVSAIDQDHGDLVDASAVATNGGDPVTPEESGSPTVAKTPNNKRKSVGGAVKTPKSKKVKKSKDMSGDDDEDEDALGGPKTKYTSRDNTVQEIREIAGSLVSNLLGREFPPEAVQFRESKASAKGYSWYVDEGEEFPTCFEREGPMRWLAPERNGVLKMLKEGKLGVEAVMLADEMPPAPAEPAADVAAVPPTEETTADPMDTDLTGETIAVPDAGEEEKPTEE